MTTTTFILLQAPTSSSYDQLLYSYGPLGIFAVLMIASIWYLVKDSKKQNDKVIELFQVQSKNYVDERNSALKEKDDVNNKMIIHLETSESKLLDIIKENSIAYSRIADSTESVSKSIVLLSNSIEKHNENIFKS